MRNHRYIYFVCHHRGFVDSAHVLNKITEEVVNFLDENKIDYFLDENANILPHNDDWENKIKPHLDESERLVVIASDPVPSKFQRWEIEYAINRGKPVLTIGNWTPAERHQTLRAYLGYCASTQAQFTNHAHLVADRKRWTDYFLKPPPNDIKLPMSVRASQSCVTVALVLTILVIAAELFAHEFLEPIFDKLRSPLAF